MSARDFNKWLASFRDSINGYDYYTDFPLAYRNVNAIESELKWLNLLRGYTGNDFDKQFKELVCKNPKLLKTLPILLAVRGDKIYCQDEKGGILYDFGHFEADKLDDYCYFIHKTGLYDLITSHIGDDDLSKHNPLIDYVIGVEVGLGSNGRKNRGGHQMEDLVEEFIRETGAEYYKEMYLADIESKWGVDLSAISAEGTTTKRWDFVIKAPSRIYVIETNFYTSGGSKLNETARSYKMIAEEIKGHPNVSFVWITDGAGWRSAQRNLHETFDVLDTLFNIKDMENGALKELIY